MFEGTPQPSAPGFPWSRRVWRVLAGLFAAAVVAVPFILINRDFALMQVDMDGTMHGLLRFSALMGISLLFLQIMTGAFRPVLSRVFAPSALYQFHKGFGLAAFGLLTCHFLFLIHSIGEHWADLDHGFFLLGPIMLTLLLVTTIAALMLRRIRPRVWKRLHVLNYAVFAVGAVHGLGIGTQTGTLTARLIFTGYLLLATAGFVYRASTAESRRRPAASRASTGEHR